MILLHSNNAEQTKRIGGIISEFLKPGDIVALSGDLGAGKTVFAQGIAEGLGVEAYVSSPTFTIIQEYDADGMPLYHMDAYRLGGPADLEQLGYEEYFFGDGVTLIEWPERVERLIPGEALWISILKVGTDIGAPGGSRTSDRGKTPGDGNGSESVKTGSESCKAGSEPVKTGSEPGKTGSQRSAERIIKIEFPDNDRDREEELARSFPESMLCEPSSILPESTGMPGGFGGMLHESSRDEVEDK